jgi:SAM-dependent methyltransferase
MGCDDPASPALIVAEGYDLIAERYRAWTRGNPVRLRFLDEVLARLTGRGQIIELGCGAGEPVARRLSERHEFTGIDISAEQLRLARTAAPDATFIQADIAELELPIKSVDAVIAFYTMGHLPPKQHRRVLAAAVSWLRPGGLLVINVPVTVGEGIEQEWLGVPMYFGGIGQDATLAALIEAGLIVERAELIEEDENGDTVRFLWIVGSTPPSALCPTT